MIKLKILVVISLLFVSACSYRTVPNISPAVSMYSCNDSKITGNYVLVVNNIEKCNHIIRPATVACSAHTYNIQCSEPFKESVITTMNSIFENITVESNASEVHYKKSSGIIIVEVETFYYRIELVPGMFSGNASATTKVRLGITIIKDNKKVLSTMIGDTVTSDSIGGGGSGCGWLMDVMNQSIEDCIQNSLEDMANRISNCEALR